MSLPVVHVAPDLSEVRLVDASGGGVWHAPAIVLGEGETAPTAAQWRERAQQAAQWMAGQRSIRRRLGALVVGVDDAVCLWVRSSSLAPPVLVASVARLTEDWGESSSVWGVEPLYDTPRDPEMGGDHALSVICHHDALIRLLLDALDKRGVVPVCVMTRWHAMAHHADAAPGVTCVIEHDPESRRLVWAWADRDGLYAGGTLTIGDLSGERAGAIAAAALQRCAMDWMTWSTQLGLTADRAVVLGPGADTIVEAWKRSFPDRPARSSGGDSALGLTLEAVAREAEDANPSDVTGSTRRCLGRLTHRPTRRTRKRYQVAGLAALIAAVAIGSIAVWMRGRAETWRDSAETARSDANELLSTTWPNGIEGRPTSLVREARRLYEQDERESTNVVLPPRPYPIYEELSRLVTMLVEVAEKTRAEAPEDEREDWSIRIQRLVMDDAQARLSLFVPQRQVATEVLVRLNEEGKLVSWNPVSGSPPERPTYQGTWQR
ncbi:MAG: hypothetical protein Tsb0013_15520 [Phycisphaerales bacterium]